MEASVISVQTVKPSLSAHDLKPFKLSLLDQLTPGTYSPFVFFYPINDAVNLNSTQIVRQLKYSLSKTLNSFYPLSGRFENNLFVHNYDAGVPFVEGRVKGHLSDFLQHPQLDLLNQFLPYPPNCHQTDPDAAPVAVQVNIFDCGGLALGLSTLHKISDGMTVSSFLKSWAANTCGDSSKVLQPNLFEASSLFPSQEMIPPHLLLVREKMWFTKCNQTARRFVFENSTVTTLRAKAKSGLVENPSRTEALSAFIWKAAMRASISSFTESPRLSVAGQAVDIRRLTKPRLSKHSFGNLIWSALAKFNAAETERMEMCDIVALIRDGFAEIDHEYLKKVSGDEGALAIFDYLNHAKAEIEKEKPEGFNFSSWLTLGYNDIDFGWGRPIWVGIMGQPSQTSPCISNLIILKEVGKVKAMEAWMILDEKVMTILEQDPEFLAFASPNPPIC